MAWYWIVLDVVVYLIIWGVTIGIFEDSFKDASESAIMLGMFWPIMFPIFGGWWLVTIYKKVSDQINRELAEDPGYQLDCEIWDWLKKHGTDENKQLLIMTARHFTKWQEQQDEKEIKNQYTLGEQAGREEVLYELEKDK